MIKKMVSIIIIIHENCYLALKYTVKRRFKKFKRTNSYISTEKHNEKSNSQTSVFKKSQEI